MDNYFEGIDFTKIEILLLIGVFLTLGPWIIYPVEYNTTVIEELEKEFDENKAKNLIDEELSTEQKKYEYSKIYTEISLAINEAVRDQGWIIGNATIAIQEARDVIEELSMKEKLGKVGEPLNLADFKVELEIEKEREKIETENEMERLALERIVDLDKSRVEIDIAIYKTLKSYEFQNRIFFAFGIAMVILIFSVYLSRKGYTSYTSWLEKLANDKLTFDLQLLQHVDKEKIKSFYHKTFQLDSERKDKPISLEKVEDKDVLEWKPIDENVEWYSVFTEKLDYRFYERFFGTIYSTWADKNYLPKGIGGPDPGEYYPRPEWDFIGPVIGDDQQRRPKTNLYTNPELAPWKNNKQIKKELHQNEKRLYKEILTEIDIFREVPEDEREKENAKVEKILIRKIQIDLLYYSVMMNFRRGLVDATEQWMEADDALKLLERREISGEAKEKDISAEELDTSIRKIIEDFAKNMRQKIGLKKEEIDKKRKKELEKIEEEAYEKRVEKIKTIKEKMINRNSWESDDWRAMGSIYYKWRESGRSKKSLLQQFISEFKSSKTDNGEVPDDFVEERADKTISEKFWEWWNKWYKGIEFEMALDPTEENWKEHRTIRAVNSLSKSFGYKVKEDSGTAVLFFGVVFGLIIAVALTNSLDILIGALQTPIDCGPLIENYSADCFHPDFYFINENIKEYQYLLILFLCFFPLGILFYHQGTILLSAKAAEQMTLGSNALIFVNFLFILVQAIVVYFLAASIGDVTSFLTFLIVLVTIDSIWVVIFTANDMRDDVRDAPVFIEWIIFDMIIALFAGVFLINYSSTPPILEEDGWAQNLNIFVMLLVVLTTRAIVDYSYGWKNFWSKFAGAE